MKSLSNQTSLKEQKEKIKSSKTVQRDLRMNEKKKKIIRAKKKKKKTLDESLERLDLS